MCVCACKYVCACLHAHVRACVRACVLACVCAFACVCMCACHSRRGCSTGIPRMDSHRQPAYTRPRLWSNRFHADILIVSPTIHINQLKVMYHQVIKNQ